MIRVNKNLAQFSFLLLILSGVFLLIFQKFSPFFSHLTYYCQTFLSNNTITIPQFVTFLPFAMLFLIFAFSVGKVLFLTSKIKLLKYKLRGEIIVNHQVKDLIKELGLDKKVNIVKATDKFAFCLGLKNPKIYISTGIIEELNREELAAVLKHEEYHLNHHDSLTMMIASVAHSLFPFFPVIGDLINKYRIEREVQADAFAMKSMDNSTSALINALKKLLKYPSTENRLYAAIAEEDTLEPRIYALINKKYLRKPFSIKNIIVTLFSFILVTIIVTMPVYAKELHHDHYDVMVFTSEKNSINACTPKIE